MGTPEPITRVVTTTAGQARICIWGDPSAEPVLLLHGTGGSAMLWDDVATRLLTDRCVVAVDLRGHGESSRPTPPSYRFADYARDVRDVARSLGSAPAVLAGHSMGALVAILLAAEGDLPIRGLAILDIEAAPPVHQVEHLRAAGARPARRFGTIEEAIAAEQRALPQVPVERLRRIIDHRYRVLPDGCLEERADREARVRAD
jgi:pimeloyl-ACP methyl ester carboxylesterase